MESDALCLDLAALERETRELRARFVARPSFRSVTPTGGRAKTGKSDRRESKQRYREDFKLRYQRRIAAGDCTTCGRNKAEHGRLCAKCHATQLEYWRKRSAEKSERRAVAGRKRVA